MKIEATGGYGLYNKKITGDAPLSKTPAAGENKKATDVAEFSRGATAIADKGFTALKANLQRDINQPAKAERLELLRSEIKNGTYRIPTEAIIDSILGD